MLELGKELLKRLDEAEGEGEGVPLAVATVTAVRGSAPRPPGATLAVDRDGTALGSISGGCVEGSVHALCTELLADDAGFGAAVHSFGYSDDDAFAVGLTCGGELDVLVQRIDAAQRPQLRAALADAAEGRAIALVTVVEGPGQLLGQVLTVRDDGSHLGSLGDSGLDREALAQARAALEAGGTRTVKVGPHTSGAGPLTLLVECALPAPRMLVFGAIDHAAALAQAGAFLGYRVTVCDARPTFATARRFPYADEVVVDWPHRYLDTQRLDRRAVVCVLTHDPKFDVPLLTRALRLPVAYVGAMGSWRTHLQRTDLLREAGLTEAELGRLKSPIGLDLGGRTPQETALSITAEIVALTHGGSGTSLSTGIPIHHDDARAGAARPDRRTEPFGLAEAVDVCMLEPNRLV
ncbi:XdhC family protein [Streptomyces sp. NPDC001536]|uniref:XdhC family protein n=1 Tax=Streptomyces sp. NPDC001536 TaxID=3364583 RepID=UPI003696A031